MLFHWGLGPALAAGLVGRGHTAGDAAYEDAEACLWQEAWLQGVRQALPWVAEVGAAYAAQYE